MALDSLHRFQHPASQQHVLYIQPSSIRCNIMGVSFVASRWNERWGSWRVGIGFNHSSGCSVQVNRTHLRSATRGRDNYWRPPDCSAQRMSQILRNQSDVSMLVVFFFFKSKLWRLNEGPSFSNTQPNKPVLPGPCRNEDTTCYCIMENCSWNRQNNNRVSVLYWPTFSPTMQTGDPGFNSANDIRFATY